LYVATYGNNKSQNQSAVAMCPPLTEEIISCRDDSVLLYPTVMNAVIVFLLKLKNMEQSFEIVEEGRHD
jgi:hypothetical protein